MYSNDAFYEIKFTLDCGSYFYLLGFACKKHRMQAIELEWMGTTNAE